MPAVNNPYTAVMSVERLTALLAALAPRQLGDIVLHDTDGPSRVVAHFPTFADYVDLAVGQIRRYGASEPTPGAPVRCGWTCETCAYGPHNQLE